jgi:transcriptional regulator with XRE-family HTH domain
MAERSNFGELLRRLRAAAGLSQPALAERCGLGLSTVRQFEQGRREPTYGTLVKLAEGLGVSLAAFDAKRDAGQAEEQPAPKRKGKKT